VGGDKGAADPPSPKATARLVVGGAGVQGGHALAVNHYVMGPFGPDCELRRFGDGHKVEDCQETFHVSYVAVQPKPGFPAIGWDGWFDDPSLFFRLSHVVIEVRRASATSPMICSACLYVLARLRNRQVPDFETSLTTCCVLAP